MRRALRSSRTVARAVFILALVPWPSLAQPAAAGPEFRVNSYTSAYQYTGGVTALAGGGFVVVWRTDSSAGAGQEIVAQRYAPGGAPLGGEFAVNVYTTSTQYRAGVAPAASGFVVVWQSYGEDGSSSGIFGRVFDSSGSGGGEFRVNTYTTASQYRPAVAGLPSQGFVVAWASADGSSAGVMAQRYSSSGAALGGEFRVNTYTTNSQSDPSVAFDTAGRFIVVWDGADGNGLGVFGQRYTSAGDPDGGEFRLNTYTTGAQFTPSVAFAPGGGFVVVWSSQAQDGALGGIFGQRLAASGAPAGPEFRVNSYTTNAQYSPHLAADGAGRFVVVWDSNYQNGARPAESGSSAPSPLGLGLGHGVIGQFFSSDGSPLGGEFRVNTYTSRGQAYARVAADSVNSFLVAWASDFQDGSGLGVYAQRYCTGPLTAVSINVTGSTSLACPSMTGGVANVNDTGGGLSTHQWGYRTTSGGAVTDIAGQTAAMYTLNAADFAGPGSYFLVETTTPSCGSPLVSNEVAVQVTDVSSPAVTPPLAATTTQTLCQ